MQIKAKTAKESLIVMTELVLPNDTNVFGNLMGGAASIGAVMQGSTGEPCRVYEAFVGTGHGVLRRSRVRRTRDTSRARRRLFAPGP